MKNQDQNQHKMPLQGETEKPSHKSLEKCLTKSALLFSRVLHTEAVESWKAFLEDYSPQAIEWAFDNWNRNGRYFPKPKEILELIATFRVTNRTEFTSCGNCEEGWVRVFAGKTVGYESEGKSHPRPVDPKTGAVKRCQCWLDWRNGMAA